MDDTLGLSLIGTSKIGADGVFDRSQSSGNRVVGEVYLESCGERE